MLVYGSGVAHAFAFGPIWMTSSPAAAEERTMRPTGSDQETASDDALQNGQPDQNSPRFKII